MTTKPNKKNRVLMMATLLVPVIGLAIAPGSAEAQFSMDPAVDYFVGTQPSGVAPGDFDADGDVDLAATVDGPDRIAVLVNDGTGSFSLGASTLLPSGSSPQDVVAGDLDGDGLMDVAVAVRDPQGAVLIMLGNGTGTFVMSGSALVQDRPRGMDIADIEGDGDLDISVANRDSNSASVLTNNGTGSFTVQSVAVGGETRATALGDFDDDGDLDLGVTDHDNREVDLFTNSGGTFSASGTLSVGPLVRPDGIAAADLDGVGPDDIAVATSDQNLNINQATVFPNAAGVFSGPLNYATNGSNTSGIVAADLDCDGAVDLATSNQDSGDVSLLQNLGAAVFGAPMVIAAGTTPEELAAADLDGDGDPDLATANRDSSDISVFINNTCTIEPDCQSAADCIDGDLCTEDICDAVLGCQNPPVMCPVGETCNPDNGICEAPVGCDADLTGDGIVDAADLAILLGSWGPCN